MHCFNSFLWASLCSAAFISDIAIATPDQAIRVVVTTTDAAQSIEEVVVTARRVSENVQTTPIAVTAVSQAEMGRAVALGSLALATVVPGLHADSSANDREEIVFNIRGQSQTYGTLFPAVVPYFAEVPLASLNTGQMYDLESLQVLRGPQGVRFGRVTDGGTILLSPRKPGNEFGGNIQANTGNYGLYGAQGAVTIPIANDVLSVRGAFDVERRDGFTRNLVNGGRLDGLSYETFRIGVLFRPTDWFESYTVYQYYNSETDGTSSAITAFNPNGSLRFLLDPQSMAAFQNAYIAQQANGPRTVSNGNLAYGSNAGMFSHRKSELVINNTSISLGNEFQIKNTIGYIDTTNSTSFDNDGTGVQVLDNVDNRVPYKRQGQLSEELQLSGKLLDDKLSISLGLYGDRQTPKGPQELYGKFFGFLTQVFIGLPTTTSRAVYGNMELDLSDFVSGLKINGGVRQTRDKIRSYNASYAVLNFTGDVPPVGVCQTFTATFIGPANCELSEASFDATTYEAGTSYKIGRLFVYANYRKGYRPGGIAPSAPPGLNVYQPEYDNEIELGAKADWNIYTIPVRTNVTVYSDKYRNIQKNSPVLVGQSVFTLVTNAASAKISGIEFEGTAVPIPGLTTGLKYSYTHAAYDKSAAVQFGPTGACNRDAPQNIGFCTLNPFGITPEHQLDFDVHYGVSLGDAVGNLNIGGSYTYQSAMYLGDNEYLHPDNRQPGYGLVNLDASWTNVMGKHFDIVAFVQNLGDKTYRVSGVGISENAGLGYTASTYAPPRMYGISLRYRFGAEAK